MKTSLTSRSAQFLAAASLPFRAKALLASASLRLTLLGALVVLGSAGPALAQDAPSVKAKRGDDAHVLALTVENPTQQRMQMRVVSLSTKTCLVNEVNKRLSYGTRLNFRDLPSGQYAVLLRVGQERYRYSVQVETKGQTTITVPELATQTGQVVAATTR